MNKRQIFTALQAFLTNYKSNPNQLKRSHYRTFFGNARGSLEWIKRKDLTEDELKTSQELQKLLTEWKDNYSSQIGISSEILTELHNELTKLLTDFPKNAEFEKNETLPNNPWIAEANDKLLQAEKGFQWLKWYENNQTWIKGFGIAIILLFAWLVIRAIKEELTK